MCAHISMCAYKRMWVNKRYVWTYCVLCVSRYIREVCIYIEENCVHILIGELMCVSIYTYICRGGEEDIHAAI